MLDCFILTFRAIARASKLEWLSLDCDVTGTLDRVDRITQFTRFEITARLVIADGARAELARQALEKAEANCLITNSLKAGGDLHVTVAVAPPAHAGEHQGALQ